MRCAGSVSLSVYRGCLCANGASTNHAGWCSTVVRLADKRGESELVAALQAIHGTHAARMGKPPPRGTLQLLLLLWVLSELGL